MSQQITLPGFDAAPLPTDRLFFAVLPERSVAQHIVERARVLRTELGLQGRLLEAGRLHISLQYLGDYAGLPPALVKSALQAGARVSLSSFAVSLDRVLSFSGRSQVGRRRAFVLRAEQGVAGLIQLHQELAAALLGAGLTSPAAARFTPHMTLLYDNLSIVEQVVEPVRWVVREFALVHGRPSQPYHLLGRWPLPD